MIKTLTYTALIVFAWLFLVGLIAQYIASRLP